MNKGNSMQQVTVNGKTYNLVKLLGKGKGGYSYLAEVDGKFVVVKKIHHEPCAYYQFGNKMQAELNDYQKLCQIGIPMPKMLDFDIDQEIIFRKQGEEGSGEDLIVHGLWHRQCNGKTIIYAIMGFHLYTFDELFNDYEWRGAHRKDFVPFGVGVEE